MKIKRTLLKTAVVILSNVYHLTNLRILMIWMIFNIFPFFNLNLSITLHVVCKYWNLNIGTCLFKTTWLVVTLRIEINLNISQQFITKTLLYRIYVKLLNTMKYNCTFYGNNLYIGYIRKTVQTHIVVKLIF